MQKRGSIEDVHIGFQFLLQARGSRTKHSLLFEAVTRVSRAYEIERQVAAAVDVATNLLEQKRYREIEYSGLTDVFYSNRLGMKAIAHYVDEYECDSWSDAVRIMNGIKGSSPTEIFIDFIPYLLHFYMGGSESGNVLAEVCILARAESDLFSPSIYQFLRESCYYPSEPSQLSLISARRLTIPVAEPLAPPGDPQLISLRKQPFMGKMIAMTIEEATEKIKHILAGT
jgi:hypothetical protein